MATVIGHWTRRLIQAKHWLQYNTENKLGIGSIRCLKLNCVNYTLIQKAILMEADLIKLQNFLDAANLHDANVNLIVNNLVG